MGIDHQSWQIGLKFKGIKSIPSGPHYIYYSLEDENYMSKFGFFILIKADSIKSKKRNEEEPQFKSLPEEKEERYIGGVKDHDFELNLGVYPMERYELWKETTNYIKEDIINKLEVLLLLLIAIK